MAKGESYEEFVDKFKPKKTTDDCLTPPNIYAAVTQWVSWEYDFDIDSFVRPFWPGGDYERYKYPEGCVVVDNPPFSILAQIQSFYIARNIKFFLFAPTLTLFSANCEDVCYIPVGISITYGNGAKVNTSFVTNLDDLQMRSAPVLYQTLRLLNDLNEKAQTKQLPKYSYPPQVLTAASAYQYSRHGIDYRLRREDCRFIRRLDAQRGVKDSGIFGGGFLLSNRAAAERAAAERAAAERAAAERAAAERAAATVWKLSEREKAICAHIDGEHYGFWFIFDEKEGET